MAVKKVKSAEVEVDTEVLGKVVTEEKSQETTAEEPTVTVDTETPAVLVTETEKESKKEQMCRVRMRVDHDCFIGGEWYYLKAGSCYNVDENVKRILSDAGLLAPL